MKKAIMALAATTALLASVAWAGMVNINTADAEALAALPGIGEAKAADILTYREENGPFESAAELNEVDGIGDATMEKLKGKITVGE
ncbi:MAG: helix-hairpin-helix domain-containing protein [Alcaligenaceae bacterium]|nr:helix-hairpin-helix domain-containing protein [Alcaligenaceae bacterium]